MEYSYSQKLSDSCGDTSQGIKTILSKLDLKIIQIKAKDLRGTL
ncbi:hypothetical protein VPHD148_0167 [Vibrio phage D148]